MVDDPALVTVIMELLVEKITLNFEQLAWILQVMSNPLIFG